MAKKQRMQQKEYCNKFNTDFQMGPHQEKKNFYLKKIKGHRRVSDVHSGWEQEGPDIKGKMGRGGQDENVIMPRSLSCPQRGADGGLYAGN